MIDTALKNSLIYQVHVGRWPEASLVTHPGQVFTRLKNQKFNHLANLGFTHIYLLGVFDSTGPIIVSSEEGQDLSSASNRLPSPFAICNHHQTHPDLGTIDDLTQLIDHLHSIGLKVILDFVPNHTGTNHPWVTKHPDYYHFENEKPIAEFSGDVYKLNYDNPQLRHEMTQILQTIASWGADGVRCDMTHLVPLDFWKQSTTQLKKTNPDFIFIAEAYSSSPFDLSFIFDHLNAGFDAIYHQPLYKNLASVFAHHHPINHLIDHINYILTQPYHSQLLHYLANHDDPLPDGVIDYFDALFALTLFLSGPTLVYNGVLNGLTTRLAHHYYEPLPTAWSETNAVPANLISILDFYKHHQPRIVSIKHSNGLVTADLASPNQKFSLVLNLTNQPIDSPFNQSGLLFNSAPNSSITSGKLEIYPAS